MVTTNQGCRDVRRIHVAGLSRQDMPVDSQASARFAQMWAQGLERVCFDVKDLDAEAALGTGGRWAVSATFEGSLVAARFGSWTGVEIAPGAWQGPPPESWSTSLDEDSYCMSVESVRDSIARGDVYQVNVCRVMRAKLPLPAHAGISGLDALLRDRNPAPYGGFIDLPAHDTAIACASPELFLSVRWVDGKRIVRSGPIKGTGRTADDLRDKDFAENVMIVDLVRNDLSRICRTGTVRVTGLLEVEAHPGLVHLVSYVEGELREGCSWQQVLEGAFPPGSVSGAPKAAALRIIGELEPVPRGPYCGAFGWIDTASGECELAVAIRTFWREGEDLCFGTGAGITWGSNAALEWAETSLKARHLIDVASGTWPTQQDSTTDQVRSS